MKSPLWLLSPIALALMLSGCGGEAYTYPVSQGSLNTPGGGTGASYPAGNWTVTDRALVVAQARQQSPATQDSFNGYLPLASLGVGPVTRGYEFTTPGNSSLSFSVVALEEGNSGFVSIRLLHALPSFPASTGAESIIKEGMSLDGAGLSYGGGSWYTSGDGLARIEVRGAIARSQVLLFETSTSQGKELIAVRLKIGGSSDININAWQSPTAGTLSRATIFSSNENGFGLPAIAVSGDRYSVTAYDSEPAQGRVRRWLQQDATSGVVTGGASVSVAPDSGTWRDQEIAALNNVLAIAYTGNNAVQAEISLDRGASFPIQQVLNENATAAVNGQRLVQIEIAPDYKVAVAYWRTLLVGSVHHSELCVVEAVPTGFDSNNTPTGYSFGTPWIVRSSGFWVVPVVMDLEYSSAGDLVLGYGYNEVIGWQVDLNYRCAIRTATGAVTDQLIDWDTDTWGSDPSVAIIGSGASMTVFYTYEMEDGIHLVELRNGGAVTGNVLTVGVPGAYLPSVHARVQNGAVRVDLLYMAPQGMGWSLKRMHWADFNQFTWTMQTSLFESTTTAGGTPSPAGIQGKIINTVGWMGYDAVTSGDDVAIALHTRAVDLYAGCAGLPTSPPAQGAPTYYSGGTVLLPGMTGTVPAPNAAHSNQLEVIVLD